MYLFGCRANRWSCIWACDRYFSFRCCCTSNQWRWGCRNRKWRGWSWTRNSPSSSSCGLLYALATSCSYQEVSKFFAGIKYRVKFQVLFFFYRNFLIVVKYYFTQKSKSLSTKKSRTAFSEIPSRSKVTKKFKYSMNYCANCKYFDSFSLSPNQRRCQRPKYLPVHLNFILLK